MASHAETTIAIVTVNAVVTLCCLVPAVWGMASDDLRSFAPQALPKWMEGQEPFLPAVPAVTVQQMLADWAILGNGSDAPTDGARPSEKYLHAAKRMVHLGDAASFGAIWLYALEDPSVPPFVRDRRRSRITELCGRDPGIGPWIQPIIRAHLIYVERELEKHQEGAITQAGIAALANIVYPFGTDEDLTRFSRVEVLFNGTLPEALRSPPEPPDSRQNSREWAHHQLQTKPLRFGDTWRQLVVTFLGPGSRKVLPPAAPSNAKPDFGIRQFR